MNTQLVCGEIRQEIGRLQQALSILEHGVPRRGRPARGVEVTASVQTKKSGWSEAQRAKQAASMKRYWAKRRKAAK